jgi:hypothetical protein
MVKNSVEEITDRIKRKFNAIISIHDEGNQFINKKLIIKDPHDSGVTIGLSFNSEGKASMVQLPGFKDANLNIAEEYTSETLLQVVFLLINGDFVIKKSLRGRTLLFVEQPRIKFMAKGDSKTVIGSYAKLNSK